YFFADLTLTDNFPFTRSIHLAGILYLVINTMDTAYSPLLSFEPSHAPPSLNTLSTTNYKPC
ncbi:hypothetical protein, partial [Staphylococcus aureus]